MQAASGHPTSLSAALEVAGLTHQELADRVAVTRQAVGHWCSGLHRPDGRSRRLIAIELGYSLDVVDGWFAQSRPEAA